ncbi:MAG: EpsI family protein [Sedimentisphaerales bacterium]|nr:EpsI family protein [Sedimentisphaerales bacterium]
MAASLLMLVSGLGYRVLASRLAAPGATPSISPAALERLPWQIGGWTGQDVPLDDAIVRATDTDAHVSRRYSCNRGLDSVFLYIASGVKARDLMPHRPEVCYTGSGWTLLDRRFRELSLDDGAKLPCNVLRFSRGVLDTKGVTVLDYYIVDGQYCHDVSLLRSKAWRGSGTVRYVAQVEIIAAVNSTLMAESATKLVCAFAGDSALPIAQLFENAQRDRDPDESREVSKGE